MGYHLAGFDVYGVDISPQPFYPFDFYQADALHFPLSGFDAIHASPPCQAFTAYKRRPQHVHTKPNLIPAVRQKLAESGLPYVIENVPGAPLLSPVVLCGSMFDLDVRRHRLFESNISIPALLCAHKTSPRFPQATNRTNRRSTVEIGVWRIPLSAQQAAMGGVDWMGLKELSQAIPPAYTKYIGSCLMRVVSGELREAV